MNTKKDDNGVEKTTTTLPSGKEIPVYTHPLPNGQAANNVQIKDMSAQTEPQAMTFEEQKKQLREMMKRSNRNVTEVGGTVTARRVNQGSLVYEKDANGKKTETPRVDEFGNEVRYADTYYITFAFRGGSKEYPVSKELYDALEVGEEYLLKGDQSRYREFGREEVGTVWHSFEFL